MSSKERLSFLDNLRTFLIFLVVLFHAGVTYDKNGIGTGWWIVVDSVNSDLPGLMNLFMDIFIMPTIFFVSGFFAPISMSKGMGPFLKTRFRRLMIPWLLAVFTLIPLYKVIFLASRGLPQEHWTTYFHFSNGIYSMNWLWFLPALFLFDCLYVGLAKLHLPTERLSLPWAVTGVFTLGLAWSVSIGALDLYGWTKTWLIDFQNERIVPYFLVFLLGSLCQKRAVLETGKKKLGLYIAVAATVWIPMNLYAIVLINFFLKPGDYIVSLPVDRLLMWIGFHASMLAMTYLFVTTFRNWIDRGGRLARRLTSLSFGVYIVHVPVLGLIAMALLDSEMPGLLKYAIAAVVAWIASNLLVSCYRAAAARIGRRS
jgi:peptidoglycan/LPS O-acetylase OafA/YrhL